MARLTRWAWPSGAPRFPLTIAGSGQLRHSYLKNPERLVVLAGTTPAVWGLLDFKAGQGGTPRADGTRAASLGRNEIDQLIGYALMDYSNTYGLHTVGVYAVRFGYLATWPLAELSERMGGRSADLADLRIQFAQVLRTALPPYQAPRGW